MARTKHITRRQSGKRKRTRISRHTRRQSDKRSKHRTRRRKAGTIPEIHDHDRRSKLEEISEIQRRLTDLERRRDEIFKRGNKTRKPNQKKYGDFETDDESDSDDETHPREASPEQFEAYLRSHRRRDRDLDTDDESDPEDEIHPIEVSPEQRDEYFRRLRGLARNH